MAAVLAVGGLTGCRSNVGVAARVNGERITETQVSSYLTPNSQPIKSQSQSGQTLTISPRTLVLNVLIRERLYRALLAKTPAGTPSDGQLSNLVSRYLAGKTYAQAATALGLHGYPEDFTRHVVRFAVLGGALDSELQSGVDVNAIARKLHFDVSVSPRYGKWDSRTLGLSADPAAGVPSFVSLQPTAAGQPSASTR